MSINAEWTNADALNFKPYTAYESASVTYSTTTTDPTSDLLAENAKLRELLSELYESACLEYPSAFEHTYGERLRELGVDA